MTYSLTLREGLSFCSFEIRRVARELSDHANVNVSRDETIQYKMLVQIPVITGVS